MKGDRTMKDRKLQKVEGQKFLYTDGERLYGRRFPDEENSNLTEEGKRLIREVEEKPTEFARRYDDNMISGDDNTRIHQTKQDETKQASEEVIITRQIPKKEEKPTSEQIEADKDAIEVKRRNIEEVKKVASEATTGENIDKRVKSGVNEKTLITELSKEEIKKWEAKNNEARAYLQNLKPQKDHD